MKLVIEVDLDAPSMHRIDNVLETVRLCCMSLYEHVHPATDLRHQVGGHASRKEYAVMVEHATDEPPVNCDARILVMDAEFIRPILGVKQGEDAGIKPMELFKSIQLNP